MVVARIFQLLFPAHKSHSLAHKFPVFLQDLGCWFLGFLKEKTIQF